MSGLIRNRKLARPFGVMMLVWALVAALVFIAAQNANTSDAAPASAKPAKPLKRSILAVSNNWDGTVDIIDGRTWRRLKRINVVPDRAERVAAIMADPIDAAFFLAIRQQIGEGHDQFADDAFTSPDGRFIYVSRPSFADVVSISLRTGKIIWRVPVGGQRADHMALSRNGRKLLVSASTANVVHVINTEKGKIVASFPSGDSPHENNFSEDQRRVFHASIGRVYTPDDGPPEGPIKGERVFEIVNARTWKVIKRLDMGEELEKAGYPDMSSAVRPMTLSPNERWLYFQVSFFHGFVEYDLKNFRVRRLFNLPRTHSQGLSRQEYLLDSAHHGIAMNPRGTRICVAGTMDDYAAVVTRRNKATKILQFAEGAKPYWVTPSANGRYCYISLSGLDRVAVIDYRKRKVVKNFRVGDHPQRMRTGWIRQSFLR